MKGTTVTAAEVARLAGVGRAAVSNWRRRHPDFPEPVGGTPTSPTFLLTEVESWLSARGKLAEDAATERLWHVLDARRGELALPDLLAVAGIALYQLQRGETGVASLPPELRDVLDATAGVEPGLLDAVRYAIEEHPWNGGTRDVFEQLYQRLVAVVARAGTLATPRELAELMVLVAGTGAETVLDPACGTGSLLEAASRTLTSDPRLLGQELDPAMARLATVRLILADAPDVSVRAGDSLRQDAFDGELADIVVCAPPFNVRDWGQADLLADERWEYGLPAKGESELAWVQHCLAHVRPGGTVVLRMPPGAASRSAGRRIRAELIRRGALRAVMTLPTGAAPPLGLPLQLWVLRKPSRDDAGTPVLFTDVTAGENVSATQLGWAAISERVLDAWREFERAPDALDPDSTMARVVPAIDLLDDVTDVTPSHHLRGPAVDTGEVTATRDSFQEALISVAQLIPPVERADEKPATTSVLELARAGALSLQRQARRLEIEPSDGEGERVLTARDLLAGREPSGRLADVDPDAHIVRLRPGDVVVPAATPRPVAVVIETDGIVLGPQLHLVRPDLDRLDPWFLAGFLQTDTVLRASTSLAGVHRVDLRHARVPLIPMEQQRRYGAAFRRIHELRQALGSLASSGESLVTSLTAGLTSGALTPAGG